MRRLQHISNLQVLLVLIFIGTYNLSAQQEYEEESVGTESETPKNNASYKLGNGLNFSFNNGDYHFGLTGFIQPGYLYTTTDGAKDNHTFTAKRTFVQFDGQAKQEKVSFFVQLDFSLSDPLLDAWIGYQPIDQLKISVGQKQSFVNNREMLFREDRLQFTERGFLSTSLSKTGREFGIFLESSFNIGDTFTIMPMVAITSGDGRNSFGENSTDSDYGGLKYGGRLDLYPLGEFKEGNNLYSADLLHEDSLKFVVGVAGSYNTGASDAVGEGHGNFFLYDLDGYISLPDYRQVYTDILMKYKGFSLMLELANSSATSLGEVYVDEDANTILEPQEISSYLALGDFYNFQFGYVTKSGYSFDARFEGSSPEFTNYNASILEKGDVMTLGFSKYFLGNNLKLQASASNVNYQNSADQVLAELLFQISF